MKEWNLKYKHFDIPLIKGNDYEIGFALGELFKKAYKKLNKLKNKLNEPKVKEYLAWILPYLRNNYKSVYEEICGRADGANIDVKLLTLDLCFEELLQDTNQEQCTSIMVKTNRNSILAHNEDGEYNQDNIRFVKIQKRGGNTFYTLVDSFSLCTANIFIGKNFVFSMNYIYLKDVVLNNLPRYMFLKLLSNCKTCEELFTLVKTIPISTACGINVCDVKNQKFYYIEKVYDKYDIKEINGVNIHTNHILAKKFLKIRPERVNRTSTSLSRLYIANNLCNKRDDLDVAEVYKILTYYGVCDFNSVMSKGNTGNKNLTFGTYILDVKNEVSSLHIHNKQNTTFELDLPVF